MFFGFEDSLKTLKKELKATGADLSYVKAWQKTYDKVRKSYPQLEKEYHQAKNDLNDVYQILKELEQKLIVRDKNASALAKELKKFQNSFNQEFLIGKEDADFHLTMKSILSLGGKDLTEEKTVLILQSEVENLLAVTKEALEKEWPDFKALAFFYLERTDKALAELPHADKITEVTKVYEKEFISPMYQILESALGEVRAKEVMEVELWIF